MSIFLIAFTDECWVDEGTAFQGLQLILQDYTESHQADLTRWSVQDYERHWLAELDVMAKGRNKGALITSIRDPAKAYRIWTWTMWKKNDMVLFQNRLLFMLEQGQNFDPMYVSHHIGSYQSHDVDGNRISEWTVPINAIHSFLSKEYYVLEYPKTGQVSCYCS